MCDCAAAGQTRPECRAGLLGRAVRDPDGVLLWVFDPLPCWLDAANLLRPEWCAPRAVEEQRQWGLKSNYSRGRRCATCARSICNQNASGLCRRCSNKRARAAQLAAAP